MNRQRCPRTVLAVLLSLGGLPAGAAEPLPLGEPFRDELYGVSIRPFEAAQRVRTDNDANLARWVGKDATTGDLLWSLRLFPSEIASARRDFPTLARALKLRLAQEAGTDVQRTAQATVGGKPTLLLAGVRSNHGSFGGSGMKSKLPDLEFRQAWIQRTPGQFLVVEWVKSAGSPGDTEASWLRLLGGVKLFDPRKAIAAKKRSIARAQKLLWETVTPQQLHAAMPVEPLWYLLTHDGKKVGWLRVQGGPARRDDRAGYEIRTWMYLQLPGQPVRLSRQRMFTTPNLSLEIWRQHIQIGDGKTAPLLVEDGLRQGGLIVSTFAENQNTRSVQKQLPEPVKDIYLPKVLGMILPKLIDRTQVGSYTFAEYNRASNDFDMRTFAVLGPAVLDHQGRNVRTVKCADQPTDNAEPLVLYVDADGQVLRSQTPDGITSSATKEDEVLLNYPKANLVVRALNRAEQQATRNVTRQNLQKP